MLSFKDISVMKSDSLIRNNHCKHEVVSLEEILEEYKLQRGIMNTLIRYYSKTILINYKVILKFAILLL